MSTVKPQSHLINIIKSTKDHHPNFVLMLGAGSSASSNVKIASEMIKEWRFEHYKMYGIKTETIEEHLKKQNWFKKPEEYSILFEKLYDEPSQRREYIESCLVNAKPSWGYIYLVNLLRNKVFNTVFTTNFDDLLNEACYLFSSEIRPIVCAHDSSITSIRITSKRPKIIKLHGDFLFDNIKNTVRELESFEKNTQEKFKQYASEFGFIFIGYAGNDRSIMDTLNTLLKFDNYFPHGIYWCVRKGRPLCEKADLLSRFPKFKIIEIEGFDDFFAELHNELNLPLQPEMSDPYKALANRLNNLIENINLQKEQVHPVIDRDIKNLGVQISSLTPAENKGTVIEINTDKLPIPYGLLSDVSEIQGNFDIALDYRIKELDKHSSTSAFIKALKLIYLSNKLEYIDDLLNKVYNSKELFAKKPMATFDLALVFIENKNFNYADNMLDFGLELSKRFNTEFNMEYYILNKMQIKAHQNIEYNAEELSNLKKIADSSSLDSKYGAYILLKNYDLAIDTLRKISTNEKIEYIGSWPITKLILPHIKDDKLLKKLNIK